MLFCVLQYQVYVLQQNVSDYVVMALDNTKKMHLPISKLKCTNTSTYLLHVLFLFGKNSLIIVLIMVYLTGADTLTK